jgi:hypothetical protein
MSEAEVTKQVSPEMERTAMQRARDRANAARWDLDVAVFFFAVLATVIILSFQGIGVEVTGPAALFGLAMGWLMGWKKRKQVYARFYDEELSRLEKELEKTMSALKEIIEERVQKAIREERED